MVILPMTLVLLVASLAASPAPAQDTPLEMATYQLVLLKRGAVSAPSSPAEQKQMQDAHLANLAELNRKRINLLYGPVTVDADLLGIAIMAVPNAAAAKAAFASDPFVNAGILTLDVHPWMGPKNWFGVPPSYDVTKPSTLEPLILGFLIRVANAAQNQQAAEDIQKGHLAYMDSLHKQGKLLVAGPFLDDAPVRGIVIYRVKDVAAAKALAAGDPAVKAGRLRLEAYPWMTLKGILK
jgi:uncharacterized protein YciI